MICTLCNTLLEKRMDDYFFICNNCGALVKDIKYYVNNKLEKERYENHNNDVTDERYQNFTSPITNKILENYNPTDLGLDYGCGTGPVITKMLMNKNFKVQLYDPYFYPDLNYLNFRYDYIFSSEVFEHFSNPKAEITKLINLLKPNGMLLIMTHLYDGKTPFKNWYYRNDPTHIFIYTHETIDFISKKFDLEIIEISNRYIFFKKKELQNAIPFSN